MVHFRQHRRSPYGSSAYTNVWTITSMGTLVVLLLLLSASVMLSDKQPRVRAVISPLQSTENTCVAFDAQIAEIPVHLPRKLSAFVHGDGVSIPNSDPYAVCEYVQDKLSFHFAHAMQQLYSCWSYWQAYPNKQPVLNLISDAPSSLIEKIRYAVYQRRNSQNSFMKGIHRLFTEKAGVTVVQDQQFAHSVRVTRVNPWLDGYSFMPGSLNSLRNMTLLSMNIEQQDCLLKPRIAIINRKTTRSVLNAHDLQNALQKEWGQFVPIIDFDERDFAQQALFFSQVDILVSPHGAQLTGIPFMPTCGGVLEIFPEGYLLPQFYGTLARGSALSHAYLHLSTDTRSVEEIQGGNLQNPAYRSKKRVAHVCPSPRSILQGVRRLYAQWNSCCSAKRSGDDNVIEYQQ